MTNIRCSSCGHDNLETNLFCAKCATSLARQQARADSNRRIFLPPQNELVKQTPSQPTRSFPALVLVLIVVVVCALVIYYW